MKIEFTTGKFIKQKIELQDNVAFLVGGSGTGKTQILKSLEGGFRGKNKNFFVNDREVHSGEFQVIFLQDQFDLKEETKLTKTSNFRNQVLKKINQLFLEHSEYQKITDQISGISLNVGQMINQIFEQNMTAITQPQIQLKFKTEKINLENIVDHLLEIHLQNSYDQTAIDPKILNHFLARMLIFNILKVGINEEDNKRPIVVLFDGPEIYTNPRTMFEMNQAIKTMIQDSNFYFIFATNSATCLRDFSNSCSKIHFLKENSLFKINDLNHKLTLATGLFHFSSNDGYQKWEQYWCEFQDIFTKQDLEKEKNFFYSNVFELFFQLIYFSDYELHFQRKNTNNNFFSLNIEKRKIFVTSDLKTILILLQFLPMFFDSWKFDSELNKKMKKINIFLKKQ